VGASLPADRLRPRARDALTRASEHPGPAIRSSGPSRASTSVGVHVAPPKQVRHPRLFAGLANRQERASRHRGDGGRGEAVVPPAPARLGRRHRVVANSIASSARSI
jgi:hypothetical protein